MSKPDGGPAFPLPDGNWNLSGGLSVRDYFAAQVLPEVYRYAKSVLCECAATMAEEAYEIADAMLAERVK